ncbi:galactose mutarotase [Segetibacter sp. 3557_3]|uniref:aldose epimerase family protein n=1 Tax=Segetibacter sp. 3557_3 TaxID=2547429 RepID=UPI0010586B6C|nr:aldose epimerase family protein [Segetibacter sp. 3557_3]TDH27283.1 galactose mutarotase [Segetibacter sp. 3557_3]
MRLPAYCIACLLLLLTSTANGNPAKLARTMKMQMPEPGAYEMVVKGKKVGLFVLRNNKVQLGITNLGARIVSLIVPDRNGTATDIVLGFDSVATYLKKDKQYFGATVGRFANRIARGKFTLDGVAYQLDVNNGPNALHGGREGFFNQPWTVDTLTQQYISLTYISRDGEQGYPGTLNTRMSYRLTNENAVEISYYATTDKKTIINLTNHAFYNLNGAGTSTIVDHIININASAFTPIDSTSIPTGEIRSVSGTAFDLRVPVNLGDRLQQQDEQLQIAKGFDHNFVLDRQPSGGYAARVVAPKTGITLTVNTTEPGMQFYDGHKLNPGDRDGKGGVAYPALSGFCLETQHYPDAPNHPNFPSTILEPGTRFFSRTIYTFGTDR